MIKDVSVKMFETSDGKRFKNEKFAALYETTLEKIQELEKEFPRVVDRSCEFANGGGYVQRTAEWVKSYLEKSWAIFESVRDPGLIKTESDLYQFDPSLSRIIERRQCFDASNREWGQPYHAAHRDARVEKEWSP